MLLFETDSFTDSKLTVCNCFDKYIFLPPYQFYSNPHVSENDQIRTLMKPDGSVRCTSKLKKSVCEGGSRDFVRHDGEKSIRFIVSEPNVNGLLK